MANKWNLSMVEQLLPLFNHPCVSYNVPKDMKYPWISVTITLRVSESIYDRLLNADATSYKNYDYSYCVGKDKKGRAIHSVVGHCEFQFGEIGHIAHIKVGYLMKHMMCLIRSYKILQLQDQINNISGVIVSEITMN